MARKKLTKRQKAARKGLATKRRNRRIKARELFKEFKKERKTAKQLASLDRNIIRRSKAGNYLIYEWDLKQGKPILIKRMSDREYKYLLKQSLGVVRMDRGTITIRGVRRYKRKVKVPVRKTITKYKKIEYAGFVRYKKEMTYKYKKPRRVRILKTRKDGQKQHYWVTKKTFTRRIWARKQQVIIRKIPYEVRQTFWTTRTKTYTKRGPRKKVTLSKGYYRIILKKTVHKSTIRFRKIKGRITKQKKKIFTILHTKKQATLYSKIFKLRHVPVELDKKEKPKKKSDAMAEMEIAEMEEVYRHEES